MTINAKKDISVSIKDLLYILFVSGTIVYNYATDKADKKITDMRLTILEEKIHTIDERVTEIARGFNQYMLQARNTQNTRGKKIEYDPYFAETGSRLRSETKTNE